MTARIVTGYVLTIRTPDRVFTYHALGTSSASLHESALACFGACGVTVKPAQPA